jgi:hypothetical protein
VVELVSAFDVPDWPPLWVLAWVWLRDRMVVDDPNLTTLRLGIPIGPAGLDLDRVPMANRPGLKTLRAVDEEIRAASRSGRLCWSGRLGESGERLMIPTLAFVEGVFEYDGGWLASPVPSHTWYALRTERAQVLKLWPGTSAVVSPRSAQPAPLRSDRQVVLEYISAEEQAGRIPRLSGLHRQHPERSLNHLRAAWPRGSHSLKRGRPKKN